MRWKSPFITRSGDFPNQNQPIDSAEETNELPPSLPFEPVFQTPGLSFACALFRSHFDLEILRSSSNKRRNVLKSFRIRRLIVMCDASLANL